MPGALELHIIENTDYSIVLHPSTYTLFKVGKTAGKVLDAYSKGEELAAISAKENLAVETVHSLVKQVEDFVGQQEDVAFDACANEPRDVLPKLELMVSNDCNLNCIYCYAHGGDYGHGASQMHVDVAQFTIDRMLEQFSKINTVVFFGGEPLMNVPAIEAACEHFQKLHEAGKIQQMPSFGVITNGTLITDRAAALIERFHFEVTVSIDGPKEINDKLRPFNSGTGSYESIKRGVDRLRERNVTPHFEVTYTQYHLDHGASPMDVLNHLHNEMGFPEGYGAIGDAEVGDGDPLELRDSINEFYGPLFDWSMQKFMDGQLLSGDMGLSIALQILFKQARTHICPAGYESLAVTTNGNIYPCHILVDQNEFIMGNVRDPRWYDSSSAENVFRMLRSARKEENPYCNKCWARYICAGCLGGWQPGGSEKVFITEARCDLKRAIWENIISKVMALKDDKTAWPKIEENLKKILDAARKQRMHEAHSHPGAGAMQLVQIEAAPANAMA